jgi:GTP-binding protein Era
MEKAGLAAIVGWTNVGKSTLLNQLVGEKIAAVAETSQTTRGRVTGVLNRPGLGQVAFVDTPGFHEPRHRVNEAMVRIAKQALTGVDVVILVVDAARGLGRGDERAAAAIRAAGGARIAALNKIDLVSPKSRLLPMMETLVGQWGFEEAIPVSARTGEGCEILVARTFARLPEGPPLFDENTWTDQTERQLSGEFIREKLLLHTRQEIPHATAVIVERWNIRENGLVEIDATILVERESQKAIVIGRQGSLLKRVGTEARRDIERMLDTHVLLNLWVKTSPEWRDDARKLREMGLD